MLYKEDAMKRTSKKVRFGSCWLQVFSSGFDDEKEYYEIRIDGGHVKFRSFPEKRFFSFLASTKSHRKSLRKFAHFILRITEGRV